MVGEYLNIRTQDKILPSSEWLFFCSRSPAAIGFLLQPERERLCCPFLRRKDCFVEGMEKKDLSHGYGFPAFACSPEGPSVSCAGPGFLGSSGAGCGEGPASDRELCLQSADVLLSLARICTSAVYSKLYLFLFPPSPFSALSVSYKLICFFLGSGLPPMSPWRLWSLFVSHGQLVGRSLAPMRSNSLPLL